MKTRYIIARVAGIILGGAMASCNDYLDVTPPTGIPPENYFGKDSELLSYVDGMYADILPSHGGKYSWGIYGQDAGTDNMITGDPQSRYVGTWYTDMNDGNYSFANIHRCNYFFHYVLPKYENGEITGNPAAIKHYIGEVYFMRAVANFNLYRQFGDMPVITEMLPDDAAQLAAQSKRLPRNEVARAIMADLDKASQLLSETDASIDGVQAKTRISNDAALLMKSRVGLFEGSWLTYHKEYVPGGEQWTGKTAYPDYKYPSGSREAEIAYFLKRSYEAADSVIANHPLVQNTGKVQQSASDPANPYMDMYATTDMSGYSEVILWRPYSSVYAVSHSVVYNAQVTNAGVGTTRSLVNSFLMSDGLPTYASPLGYSEEGIKNVRKNRDSRITVWLKEPGQVNYWLNMDSQYGSEGQLKEPDQPAIVPSGQSKGKATTGYMLRIGNSPDREQNNSEGGYTGSPSYMAAEAYCNYIEAYYMAHGDLGGKVRTYWDALRQKHGNITASIDATIAATDMAKEATQADRAYDWGIYSAGKVLTDKTLYSIRRERRCELMAMGLRDMDLCRWRSMDQLKTTKYHVEGFQLWDKAEAGAKVISDYSYPALKFDPNDPTSTVSSPERSKFLCPFEIISGSTAYNGLGWHYAYYLRPIPIKQFQLAPNELYQNPGWSTAANTAPEL